MQQHVYKHGGMHVCGYGGTSTERYGYMRSGQYNSMAVKQTLYLSEEQVEWASKQPRNFSFSEFVRWCIDVGITNVTEYQKGMEEEEKVLNTD